ncbi:MAG: hypothetical protein LBL07_01095, partial [Tannerella sp.]|nr:hypothetical protein [Tannerella sp.]
TGITTATGLSRLLEGELSHDKISRLLSGHDFTSKDLWQHVKPPVRMHETEDTCLIFDDTIIGKPYKEYQANDIAGTLTDVLADLNLKAKSSVERGIYQTEKTLLKNSI